MLVLQCRPDFRLTGVDQLLPIVEMLIALASGDDTVFHYKGNIKPPRHMAQSEQLVRTSWRRTGARAMVSPKWRSGISKCGPARLLDRNAGAVFRGKLRVMEGSESGLPSLSTSELPAGRSWPAQSFLGMRGHHHRLQTPRPLPRRPSPGRVDSPTRW